MMMRVPACSASLNSAVAVYQHLYCRCQVSQKPPCAAAPTAPAWQLERMAGNVCSSGTIAHCCSGSCSYAMCMSMACTPPQPLLQHPEQLVAAKGDQCKDGMHPQVIP